MKPIRKKKTSKKTDSTSSLVEKKRTTTFWLATLFSIKPKTCTFREDHANPGFIGSASSMVSMVELNELVKYDSTQNIHGSQRQPLDEDPLLTEIAQLKLERDNMQAENNAMKDTLQTKCDHINDQDTLIESLHQELQQEKETSAALLERLQHKDRTFAEKKTKLKQSNAALKRSNEKLLCENIRLRQDKKAPAKIKVINIYENTKCMMVGDNNMIVSKRSTTTSSTITSRSSTVSDQFKRKVTRRKEAKLPLPKIPDSTANWVNNATHATVMAQSEMYTLEQEQVQEFCQSTKFQDRFGGMRSIDEKCKADRTDKPKLCQVHDALTNWRERSQGKYILSPEQLPRSVLDIIHYLQSLGGKKLDELFGIWKISVEDIPQRLLDTGLTPIISYGLQLWLHKQIEDTAATAPHLELYRILKKL